MMRYLKLILVSAALLLAGCPASTVYTIYNNTRWNLVVELKDEQVTWVAGSPLRIDSKVQGKMEWVNENGQSFPVLKVRHGEAVGVYKFTSPAYPIPDEYRGKEYRFQLQEDGNLYIMMRDDSYPARRIRFQPPGFPMAATDPSFKLWSR